MVATVPIVIPSIRRFPDILLSATRHKAASCFLCNSTCMCWAAPAFNLNDQTLQFKFDAQLNFNIRLRIPPETFIFVVVRITGAHRLSDKFNLKQYASLFSQRRGCIIRFPAESSIYFCFLAEFSENPADPAAWYRCSVSVVAHYRELFRPGKQKYKALLFAHFQANIF